MEPIYIPRLLKAPRKTETLDIEQFIPNLETLTPVRGRLSVTHRGTYLEVRGRAEAIVTLTCDRSLQQYNHRLEVDTSEMIWLQDSCEVEAGEREVSGEDLTESLPPDGYFDPQTWIYEQLCLAMPLRRVSDRSLVEEDYSYTEAPQGVDSRWAALEALKEQLSQSGR